MSKEQSDEEFRQYLLGRLPGSEMERLDELSIADDEFAMRLSEVEDDLVDAYVRGELEGEQLQEFKKVYLSSPRRREKVAFAEALFAWQARQQLHGSAVPSARPQRVHTGWTKYLRVGWSPKWAFAACALLFVIVAGFVLHTAWRRPQMDREDNQGVRSETQIKSERVGNSSVQATETSRSTGAASRAPSSPMSVNVATYLLPIPTRGLAPIPQVRLVPGTSRVKLQLQTGSSIFSTYMAELRNPATRALLWRSGPLAAEAANQVPVILENSVLSSGTYVVELRGIDAHGKSTLIADYVFHVVRQ